MNLALLAITEDGIKVAERIKKKLDSELTVFLPQKLKQTKLTATRLSRICGLPQGRPQATYFSKKLVDLVGDIFSEYDGLIFIMASGIVVRVRLRRILKTSIRIRQLLWLMM